MRQGSFCRSLLLVTGATARRIRQRPPRRQPLDTYHPLAPSQASVGMWLAGTGLSPGNQHLGAGQEHSDPKRKHSSVAQPDPRPLESGETLGR